MQAIAAINAKPESGSAGVVQNGAKKSKTSSFASLLDSLKSAVGPEKPTKASDAAMREMHASVPGKDGKIREAQAPIAIAASLGQPMKSAESKKAEGKASGESLASMRNAKEPGLSNFSSKAVQEAVLKKTGSPSDAQSAVSEESADSGIPSLKTQKKKLGSPGAFDLDSAAATASGMLSAAQDRQGASVRRADSKELEPGMKLSTERNASGAKFSVVDMRLKASKEGSKNGSDSKQESSDRQSAEPGMQAPAFDSRDTRAELGRAPEAAGGKQALPETKNVSFADQLASRIRESAGTEIVKAAQIVLRDGDSGLIRLRLDPESLGGVKIELKIADKKLSGVIVVESDMAGQAFKDSLEGLRDAFNASGFETQSLEVEVRNGNSGGQGSPRDGDGKADPYFSQRLKELDAAVPQIRASASRDGLLNVVI